MVPLSSSLGGFIPEKYIVDPRMVQNKHKIMLGAVLLLVSSVLILGVGVQGIGLPTVAGSLAALGLAAGSLLIGTSEGGQPV